MRRAPASIVIAPFERDRRCSPASGRRRAIHARPGFRRPAAAISRKPIRRSRKAATADLVGRVHRRRRAAAGVQRRRGPGAAPGSAPRPAPRRSAGPTAARSSLGAGQGAGRARRRRRRSACACPAAQLGQGRAVGVFHQAVDDRLRMDQHVDPVRPAWRTGRRPRSSPGPCSSSCAESTEILAPMLQFGWATACSARGARASASRVQPRNGPPEAVRISRATRSASVRLQHLEDRRMLGIDRDHRAAGRLGACPAAPGRRRPGSPCWPGRSPRRCAPPPGWAPGPPTPTIADITQSAPMAGGLDDRRGAGRGARCRSRPAARAARAAGSRPRSPPAAAASAAPARPAARRCGPRSGRSISTSAAAPARSRSRVETPTEPVEPRTVTRARSHQCAHPNGRSAARRRQPGPRTSARPPDQAGRRGRESGRRNPSRRTGASASIPKDRPPWWPGRRASPIKPRARPATSCMQAAPRRRPPPPAAADQAAEEPRPGLVGREPRPELGPFQGVADRRRRRCPPPR